MPENGIRQTRDCAFLNGSCCGCADNTNGIPSTKQPSLGAVSDSWALVLHHDARPERRTCPYSQLQVITAAVGRLFLLLKIHPDSIDWYACHRTRCEQFQGGGGWLQQY